MTPQEKAALIVSIGVLGALAVVSGLWLDERILHRKAVWLNWILGICCGLSVVAEAFLILYTYYAYRWFTSPAVLQVAIGIPLGIVAIILWDETRGHPGWRAVLIFVLFVLLCGPGGAPSPG